MAEEPKEARGMTPSQVVAYRLFVARSAQGWTQEQAAEALEPFLGERWSKATFSAAERSIGGRRVRDFSVSDVVAFARCFRLPVAWWYTPPIDDPYGLLPKIEPPDDEARPTVDADELVELVLGREEDTLSAVAGAWGSLSTETRARYRDRVGRHLYPEGEQPPIDKRPDSEQEP